MLLTVSELQSVQQYPSWPTRGDKNTPSHIVPEEVVWCSVEWSFHGVELVGDRFKSLDLSLEKIPPPPAGGEDIADADDVSK